MEAVKGLYFRAVKAAVKRAVVPLYEAAGLTWPQGEPGQDQAGPGRTRPGRVLDPDHRRLNRNKLPATLAPRFQAAAGRFRAKIGGIGRGVGWRNLRDLA